jgi:signal transduction histidine kinase
LIALLAFALAFTHVVHAWGVRMRHRGAVERGVLTGVAVLRWAAWAWLAGVTVANLKRVDHPLVAVAAVIATGVVTALAQAALRGPGWERAMGPALLSVEVGVAFAVIAADGWVKQGRVTGQNLAGLWPLAAILVAAVAGGAVWGAGVGVFFSLGRALAAAVAGVPAGQAGRTAVGVVSTAVSWVLVGAVCGTIVRLLRRSQHQLAEAEARERIARDLHDGVLQTLALIERRSPSPDIARLARDQERDLRAYLFDDQRATGGLAAGLRDAAARLERAWPRLRRR